MLFAFLMRKRLNMADRCWLFLHVLYIMIYNSFDFMILLGNSWRWLQSWLLNPSFVSSCACLKCRPGHFGMKKSPALATITNAPHTLAITCVSE